MIQNQVLIKVESSYSQYLKSERVSARRIDMNPAFKSDT